MPSEQNRRRKKKKKLTEFRELWGSLFTKNRQEENLTQATIYSPVMDDGEEEEETPARASLFRRLWMLSNFWALMALLLFVAFIITMVVITVRMWLPQDLSDIEGYDDTLPSRNLERLICRKAPLREVIVIPEADVNRYLRDTCRIRQDGFFSIFSQGHGIAVRFHDGYAELIIDRVFGRDTHQTTAVNISFTREVKDEDAPELHVALRGGKPIFGTIHRGGRIGKLAIPQRHIVILQPALETLKSSYPAICDVLLENGYCPFFEEGRVVLRPYSTIQSPKSQQ